MTMAAPRVMDVFRAADFSPPELKWLPGPTFSKALRTGGVAETNWSDSMIAVRGQSPHP